MTAYTNYLILTIISIYELTASASSKTAEQTSAIIGGTLAGSRSRSANANFHEYPYMASLHYKLQFKCGAAIIKPNFVLSAAHCIIGRDHHLIQIKAGTYLKKDFIGENVQVREVESMKYHSKYDQKLVENDIAILKLKTNFVLNSRVNIIKLSKSSKDFIGETATILGFGKMENDEKSKFLRIAEVTVAKNKECSKIIAEAMSKQKTKSPKLVLQKSHMCTLGAWGDKGGCDGDSGGPLVNHITRTPSDDILIGIISYVLRISDPLVSCAVSLPMIYTDIGEFRSWIEKQMFKMLNS